MTALAHPHTASPTLTTRDDQPAVAIVGASITGPTLALLLHQAGLRNVTVLDASTHLHTQAGGVIGLEHTALDVLDSIGVPQREFVPFTSERVVAVKVADRCEAGRTHTFYPGRSTVWHLINTALLQRLPEGWLRLGSRVHDLTTGPDSRAQLRIADADPISADLVVFADGRRSIGRRLLDPDRKLRYGGYVAWRGQAPTVPQDLRDYTRIEPYGAGFHLFPILRRDGSTATDWTFYLNHSEQELHALLDAEPTRRTRSPRMPASTSPPTHGNCCPPRPPTSSRPLPPGPPPPSSTSPRPSGWSTRSAATPTPSCWATRWPRSGPTPPAAPTTASSRPPPWSPR
ncbi:FAD-dependent monooxygenase [Nonomuraea harbinensis]|uniref:FAD-dependent monooxygenase n=1 Tax=Nonomuraea harbinensis TaxID=1286938 RepID=A0ABW1C5S5_9ACTN|nr:FAD-dependent monooxygenase [Nonomuraea harbinensis]